MFLGTELTIALILNSFGGRKIKKYDQTVGTYSK